jgi:acyl-CoA synthetase (NDP forming)
MHTFFHPSSIAVIGASRKRLGGQVMNNLLYGFKNPIYPVNPNYDTIFEIPCYPSLEAVPHPVDLAIVVVPAGLVPSVLQACARKGVQRVIIQSAGFAEVGEEGIALQQYCKAIAKESGIRLWGPNCMGLVDVPNRHFFTFMTPNIYLDGLIPGRISLIVQSGMLSAIFLAELARRGIGVSKACSIGNRVDVDECDLLAYFLDDPETDVIALYLESMSRGRLFAHMAKNSSKPIVVLKGGRSEAGAVAAMSHTYSLSGDSRLLDSIFRMCGIISAEEMYQMMDVANALTMLPTIPSKARTAIITLSGGAGILACDALERRGLEVATLSPATREELSRIFPDWMPVSNPIDLFPAVGIQGRAAAYARTIPIVLRDPTVDALLIHYVAGLEDDSMDMAALKQEADKAGKAVFFWLMGRRQGSESFQKNARENGLPVHGEISRISACLAAAGRYRPRKANPSVSRGEEEISGGIPLRLEALSTHGPILDEHDTKEILRHYRLPVVEEAIVHTEQQAVAVAGEMGYPVVLKGLVPGDMHKTESGMVILHIHTAQELEKGLGKIGIKLGANGRILLQKQVHPDYELMAGFLRDREFGPCVMFGLGGTLAELDPDVVFALAPLPRNEAVELMAQIRGKRLLDGFRGMRPLDRERMADILVALAHMGAEYPFIEHIDVNPVVVHQGMPVIVDAGIVLAKDAGGH